ncbi:MAG: hypothetical protein KIT80_11030 [Chitinophagaceae bacterium]|nr:hypothetical protein [Chitinophagaceae bacterium]MCW5927436.1 hypothetical protein [Chitinophagaceae bacterium]
MLDNLLNLVKEHAGEAIAKNNSIPGNRKDEVIADAANSIEGGFQNLLSQGGGINDVLKLFSGQSSAQNNVSQQFTGNFVQDLIGKFGLDNNAANGIAGSLIPAVLSNLVSKTNDPNDSSFDIQSLLNNFSGGKTAGFNVQGLLDKVKSGALDLDGDGDTDLQDIMLLVSKGKSGGGLMDTIKGMFGK